MKVYPLTEAASAEAWYAAYMKKGAYSHARNFRIKPQGFEKSWSFRMTRKTNFRKNFAPYNFFSERRSYYD